MGATVGTLVALVNILEVWKKLIFLYSKQPLLTRAYTTLAYIV
jgi:hypothetical protein